MFRDIRFLYLLQAILHIMKTGIAHSIPVGGIEKEAIDDKETNPCILNNEKNKWLIDLLNKTITDYKLIHKNGKLAKLKDLDKIIELSKQVKQEKQKEIMKNITRE